LKRASLDLARRAARAEGFKRGDEIVIEARDAWGRVTATPGYEEVGQWRDSTVKVDDPRLVGKGARFTHGQEGPAMARFTPDIPIPGNYEVFVIFSFSANAEDTTYRVHSARGSKTIEIPQRGRPGTEDRNDSQWQSLGTFPFTKGQSIEQGCVALHTGENPTPAHPYHEYRAYTVAVRFVFQGE
jgi:hypothetical protein